MTTLTLDVLWRDRGAKRGLIDVGDASDRAGKRMDGFKMAATAAGAIAGAAIFKFGKDSVSAYVEAESSQARLQDAFRKFPRLADTSLGALQNYNSELAKKTRFDDDATASGQAVLAQFQLTGRQITELTPLLQDYAAKTGKDLPSAAQDLGKAVLGQGRALKSVGLNLKDTGSAAGNLDQVMKGLRQQVGGFAEREGLTAAGRAEILKNQFGELQEATGEKLLPALIKVGEVLLDTVGFVERNSKVIGPLVVAVGGLAGAIWTVNAAGRAWTATQAAWTTVTGVSTAATTAQTASVVTLRTALLSVAGPAAALGVAIGGVWAGGKIGEWQAAQVAVDDVTAGMRRNAGQARLSSAEIELLSNKGLFGMRDELGSSSEALESFGNMAHRALDQGWDARLGRLQSMGSAQSKFRETTEQLDDSFAKMVRDGHVDQAHQQMKLYEQAAADAGVPVASLRAMFPRYSAALKASVGPTQDSTGALKDQTQAAQANLSALRQQASQLLGLRGSESGFEAAVDNATEALKRNGATLRVGTTRGRENRAALDAVASATLAYREAAEKAGKSQGTQNRIVANGREQLVRMGQRFGMTKDKANEYARAVLGLPKSHTTRIQSDTRAAQTAVRNFRQYVNRQLDTINDERVNLSVAWQSLLPKGVSLGQLMRGDGPGMPPSGPPRHGHGEIGDGPVTLSVSGSMPNRSAAVFADQTERIVDRLAAKFDARAEATLRAKARKWLEGSMGGGLTHGWRAQWRAVHAAFPWAALHSAFRPGAITATGNRSYHSMGRAIDVSPSMTIFNWIRSRYGRNTKELIYSPAGGRQVHNGRPHYYTGITRAMHFNHVHWAMDRGGVARGPGVMLKPTALPERVLSPAQTASFDRLVQVLDRAGGTVTQENHYHLPNGLYDTNGLIRTLDDLARTNRLPRARGA